MKISKITFNNLYSKNSNNTDSINNYNFNKEIMIDKAKTKPLQISKFPKYEDSFYKMENQNLTTKIKSQTNIGINFDIKL